jgi:O-antigen/teichoic acid export membrane protein
VTTLDAERSYEFATTGLSRTAIKGVLWSLIMTFAPSAVAGLVFLFTSRTLGPKEFGLVALASAIATVAGALAPVGFGQAIVQRKTIERRHLDSVFWLCVGSSILFYGALLVGTPFLARYLGAPELRLLLPVLGLRIIFDLVGTVPHAVLGRTMSFDKMAIRTTVASVMGGVVCLGALWLGYGLWALALSQLVLSFTSAAGSLLAARWWPRLAYDRRAVAELAHFGGFSSGINFVNLLNLDQILIGGLLGVFQLGLYGFARRIFQIMSDVMAGPLNSVSFSLLASLQSDEGRRREAFLFATFLSALISFPAFAGLATVAGDLVPLVFGEHWNGAVFALQTFGAIGVLTSIGVLQSSLINAHGDAAVWFTYLLIKQGVTVTYILLFNRQGLDALMLSMIAINYTMWIPTLFIVARILRLSTLRYVSSFAVPAAATFLMVLAVCGIRSLGSSWPVSVRLCLSIAAGGAIYTTTVLLLARDQLERMRGIVFRRKAA